MTTVTTQDRGAWSVASVKIGNPSLVLGRCKDKHVRSQVKRRCGRILVLRVLQEFKQEVCLVRIQLFYDSTDARVILVPEYGGKFLAFCIDVVRKVMVVLLLSQ